MVGSSEQTRAPPSQISQVAMKTRFLEMVHVCGCEGQVWKSSLVVQTIPGGNATAALMAAQTKVLASGREPQIEVLLKLPVGSPAAQEKPFLAEQKAGSLALAVLALLAPNLEVTSHLTAWAL